LGDTSSDRDEKGGTDPYAESQPGEESEQPENLKEKRSRRRGGDSPSVPRACEMLGGKRKKGPGHTSYSQK